MGVIIILSSLYPTVTSSYYEHNAIQQSIIKLSRGGQYTSFSTYLTGTVSQGHSHYDVMVSCWFTGQGKKELLVHRSRQKGGLRRQKVNSGPNRLV